MRVTLQRVSGAEVRVGGEVVGSIGPGYLLLVGFRTGDGLPQIEWMSNKILGLRVFLDDDGKMNRSVEEVGGDILVVSQFTLCAETKKGRRPSFVKTAKPELGEKFYNSFIQGFKERGVSVATGIFGAMMHVQLVNDGPVTFVLDSKISLMSG